MVDGGISRHNSCWGLRWGAEVTAHDCQAAVCMQHLLHNTAVCLCKGAVRAVDGTAPLMPRNAVLCSFGSPSPPVVPQSDIEAQLHRSLGIDKVIWLGKGVVGDTDTNGTVQLACNVCAPQ